MDFPEAEVANNSWFTVNKATPSSISVPLADTDSEKCLSWEREKEKCGKKGYSIRCRVKLGLTNDCQTSRDPRDKNAWPTKDEMLMRSKTRGGVRQKSASVEGVQRREVVLTKTGAGEGKGFFLGGGGGGESHGSNKQAWVFRCLRLSQTTTDC